MEGNNFEKEVRKVLEGMEISPSDHSWTNVRKRIRKKRDRRLVPLLFVLLGLLLAAGGYWIWNGERNAPGSTIASAIKSEQPHISESEQPHTSPARDSAVSGQVRKPVNGDKKNILQKGLETKSNAPKNQITIPNMNKQVNIEPLFQNERVKKNIEVVNSAEGERIPIAVNELQAETGREKEKDHFSSTTILGKIPELPDDDLSLEKPVSVKILNSGTVSIYDKGKGYFQKKPAKKGHLNSGQRKWRMGISLSAGVSRVGHSFLESEKSMDAMGMGSPVGGVGNGSAGVPSVPKQAFAFSGGFVAKKKISPATHLSLGINYQYYSTTNLVGGRISAAADYYYSRNQTNSSIYKNSFHFVELPVVLDVRLTKMNSLPLFWNGGVYLKQLISTNALQSGTTSYYSDDALFNKTYFGLSTGFFVSIFSKQKVSLNIGPYIKYDLSKIADKGLYSDNHFSFLGIRSEILFPGKK